VATFDETLHDLLDPFLRKVDHCPLRYVTRLIVFLVSHVPLAVVLKDTREFSLAHENG